MMPRNTSRGPHTLPWPGLPRSPTSSDEAVIEIFPEWVIAMDQLHLPRPAPMLDVHLALFGLQDVVVPLGVDEAFQSIFLGKAAASAFPMLPRSPREIHRCA